LVSFEIDFLVSCQLFADFSPIGCMESKRNLDNDDNDDEDIGDDYLLKKKLKDDVDF